MSNLLTNEHFFLGHPEQYDSYFFFFFLLSHYQLVSRNMAAFEIDRNTDAFDIVHKYVKIIKTRFYILQGLAPFKNQK